METIVNTNFQLATAVISNGAITGNKWSNPNNLLLTDGDVAESNPNQTASDVIIGNFSGANVPANAVITGIEIELIGAYSGSPTVPAIALTLQAVDNTSGNDVYYPYTAPVAITPTPTNYILGSSTYLFATSWTPNMINNIKLALIANGDINIDAVKINVFYFIPVTPPLPPPPPNSCSTCNSPIQVPDLFLALPFYANDRFAYLKSFNYADGTPVQFTDLGACGGFIDFVFDPGVVQVGDSNFMENARTAMWTTLPNGLVQLDFIDVTIYRGLQFHEPYGAQALLRSNHDANSRVIISDNGPFLGQLIRQCQIGSVVSAPIDVQYNGSDIVNPMDVLNFVGGGVTVVADFIDPKKVNVTIPGSGGTNPPIPVNTNSATSGNVQVPTLSFNLVSTGINRGVVVQVSTEQAQTIIGITAGGIPLTQVVSEVDVANNLRNEQWVLVAPPLGTIPIVITLSGNAYISAGGEIYNNVDQTTPTGQISTTIGTSTSPSTSFTTLYNNSVVISGLTTALTPILYTPGIGSGSNWSQTANSSTRQGGSSIEPTGTAPDAITLAYTITQNTNWAMTGMELKGVTSSPLLLQTNGVNNGNQAKLNLIAGTSTSIHDDGLGNITINNTGGGGGSQAGIQFQDESGGNLGTSGTVDTFEITGTGITGTRVGNKVTYTFAGGGSGSAITETVHQVAHGLSVGNPVRSSGVPGSYTKSQADTAPHAEVIGYVSTVVGVDDFIITTEGYVVAGVPVQAEGTIMFLDDAVSGNLVTTPPTVAPTINKPLLTIITSGSIGYFHNYRGQENQTIPTGVNNNGNITKNASDASVVQLIPHGLGAVPASIYVKFYLPAVAVLGGGNVYQMLFAEAFYNVVTQSSESFHNTGAGLGDSVQDTTFTLNASSLGFGPHSQVGTITADATNIIITWVKTNSPTGIYNGVWKANT